MPGWKYPKYPGWKVAYHFGFFEPAEIGAVMRDLLDNIRNVGIPYLESLSSWQSLAEYHVGGPMRLLAGAMTVDCFVMAGQIDRARTILLEKIERQSRKISLRT